MNAAASPHVLVIDDEPDLRTLYELTLIREGYRVQTAESVAHARARLAADHFDLVLTDMRLPDGNGVDLMQSMTCGDRPERWIVITAYGSAENAVQALKSGAFDYLTKPVELAQFRKIVQAALQASDAPMPTPAAEIKTPEAAPRTPDIPPEAAACESSENDAAQAALQRIVGRSALMQAVRERIQKVAQTMAPVLIFGESGTGKELAARAVHACSHRHAAPFVAVNCGAIPENLLEAEFFGARKGAYTGAAQDRKGYFQAAQGGTLFLDEIGDLPMSMQAKLLRAIQERRVRALGATQEEEVDVRIVSATHKNLSDEVHAGRFRHDLFYRLNVIGITLPPLRERREDIPAIADTLLQRIAAQTGDTPATLSQAQQQALMQAALPGNVRELENLLHRAYALRDGETLALSSQELQGHSAVDIIAPSSSGLPVENPATTGQATGTRAPELPHDLEGWLDAREREILVRALEQTGYNRTAAAALLGLNLRQIRYRMERLKIAEPKHD